MTDYSTAASTVKTALDAAYQEKLVSAENIKTINNQSLLGSGNISIGGGGGGSTTIYEDDCSVDNTSNYGSSIPLRSGSSTLAYNSNGYYTITNNSSQAESFIPITDLTGTTGDFTLEYDSYVEQVGGSSGLVVYNSSTSWEKLTDDADSVKGAWYGYNDGSFHETKYTLSDYSYQKWVHYKYTFEDDTFTIKVTYNDTVLWTHTETMRTARGSSTQYGLDSEWQRNTVTRYKNIVVKTIGSGGGSSVEIVTSWDSTLSDDVVPSEKLVKDTLDTKIGTSSTSGLVKNDGTIDTNTYLTSSSISDMLTSSDIADNLTTNDATKVLSAKQGKALNDLIGQAISYINQ